MSLKPEINPDRRYSDDELFQKFVENIQKNLDLATLCIQDMENKLNAINERKQIKDSAKTHLEQKITQDISPVSPNSEHEKKLEDVILLTPLIDKPISGSVDYSKIYSALKEYLKQKSESFEKGILSLVRLATKGAVYGVTLSTLFFASYGIKTLSDAAFASVYNTITTDNKTQCLVPEIKSQPEMNSNTSIGQTRKGESLQKTSSRKCSKPKILDSLYDLGDTGLVTEDSTNTFIKNKKESSSEVEAKKIIDNIEQKVNSLAKEVPVSKDVIPKKKAAYVSLDTCKLDYSEFHSVPENTVASAYSSLLEEWSSVYGVDPLLMCAIMKNESNFNVNAVSPTGATGLCQITYGTGKGIKQHLTNMRRQRPIGKRKCKDGSIDDRFKPENAIPAGYAILKNKLGCFEKYSNAIAFGVAAYNGGESTILKAISETGVSDPSWEEVRERITPEFLYSIPEYKERADAYRTSLVSRKIFSDEEIEARVRSKLEQKAREITNYPTKVLTSYQKYLAGDYNELNQKYYAKQSFVDRFKKKASGKVASVKESLKGIAEYVSNKFKKML